MNKSPTQRLLRMASIASFVLAACDSTIPPQPPLLTPDQLVGTYYLESWRGQELPATGVTTSGVTQTVFQGLLRLNSNETYELRVDWRSCFSTGACDEILLLQYPTGLRWLVLYDGRLDFEGGNESRVIRSRGTSDGRTIVFDPTAVFRRVDPTLQPRALDMRPDSLMLARGQIQNVFATTIPYSTMVINIVVRDTTIATLLPSGALQARSAGVTYIVASVAALRDSSKVIIR